MSRRNLAKPIQGRKVNARRLQVLEDGLATITQVAEYLSVDRHVIDDLINSGELPYLKIGPRQTRIPVRCVQEYLADRLRNFS